MYKHVYSYIRVTDKFFDEAIINQFKEDIKNKKYITPVNVDVVPTMSGLLSLFGLHIDNIEDDEYHWADFKANLVDLTVIEQILRDYAQCFHKYTKVCFREENAYEYWQFDFELGQLLKNKLSYINSYIGQGTYKTWRDGDFFYQETGGEIQPSSAVDSYSDFMNGWSNDSESYTITHENGFYKCEYNVIVYDGISISIFGYGHDKYESMRDCDRAFNELKETAIKNGWKEDKD